MWDPQWEGWAGEFELVRCDHRGFGDSDDPVAAYGVHTDALEVLDDAGVGRAAVIGASMGGQAAIDLALALAERCGAENLAARPVALLERAVAKAKLALARAVADLDLDAEPVGERQHTRFVRIVVVAVANEDLRWLR